MSRLASELCVRSRAPRCLMSSGSARTTCWRASRAALKLRAPSRPTTLWASWGMWSQASSTLAAPLTRWAESSRRCMLWPPQPGCLWMGSRLLSCSSCLCLWVQRSSSWWGWGCGWFRENLCSNLAAGGNNLLWNNIYVQKIVQNTEQILYIHSSLRQFTTTSNAVWSHLLHVEGDL